MQEHVKRVRGSDDVCKFVTDVIPLCAHKYFSAKANLDETSQVVQEINHLVATVPASVRPVNPLAHRAALLWLGVAVCSRPPQCVDCLRLLLSRMPAAFTAAVTEAAECATSLDHDVVQQMKGKPAADFSVMQSWTDTGTRPGGGGTSYMFPLCWRHNQDINPGRANALWVPLRRLYPTKRLAFYGEFEVPAPANYTWFSRQQWGG